MHYYQRWAENDKAMMKARAQAQDTSERQLHRLSELTATPTSQLKFICDAWDQVRPSSWPLLLVCCECILASLPGKHWLCPLLRA